MNNNTTPHLIGGGAMRSSFEQTIATQHKKRVPYYYEGSGREHDDLLRCKDCGRLVTYVTLMTTGMTPCCGTRKVRQVQHLRFWEWLQIRLGRIDFPRRAEFLREFSRVRA